MWAVFPGREAKPLLPPPRGGVAAAVRPLPPPPHPPAGGAVPRGPAAQAAGREGKGGDGQGGGLGPAGGAAGGERRAGRAGKRGGGTCPHAGACWRARACAGWPRAGLLHTHVHAGVRARARARAHKGVRAHVPASAHIMQGLCTHIYTRAGMYGCVWIRVHTRACTQRAGSCCRTPCAVFAEGAGGPRGWFCKQP